MRSRFYLDNQNKTSEEVFDDFEQAIPLMSEEEEKALTEAGVPESLPILPLKNTVLFPGVVVPITVGRDRSLALVKEAYAGDKIIGVVTQKDENIEERIETKLGIKKYKVCNEYFEEIASKIDERSTKKGVDKLLVINYFLYRFIQ